MNGPEGLMGFSQDLHHFPGIGKAQFYAVLLQAIKIVDGIVIILQSLNAKVRVTDWIRTGT